MLFFCRVIGLFVVVTFWQTTWAGAHRNASGLVGRLIIASGVSTFRTNFFLQNCAVVTLRNLPRFRTVLEMREHIAGLFRVFGVTVLEAGSLTAENNAAEVYLESPDVARRLITEYQYRIFAQHNGNFLVFDRDMIQFHQHEFEGPPRPIDIRMVDVRQTNGEPLTLSQGFYREGYHTVPQRLPSGMHPIEYIRGLQPQRRALLGYLQMPFNGITLLYQTEVEFFPSRETFTSVLERNHFFPAEAVMPANQGVHEFLMVLRRSGFQIEGYLLQQHGRITVLFATQEEAVNFLATHQAFFRNIAAAITEFRRTISVLQAFTPFQNRFENSE